jgi:hypothetical protein
LKEFRLVSHDSKIEECDLQDRIRDLCLRARSCRAPKCLEVARQQTNAVSVGQTAADGGTEMLLKRLNKRVNVAAILTSLHMQNADDLWYRPSNKKR